jgi:16S rRNA processing protein RimM
MGCFAFRGKRMDDLIVIGEAMSAWGLKGALRIRPLTDFMERFNIGENFTIEGTSYIIETSRANKGAVILKLIGIDTPEDAEKLHHKNLEIPAARLMPLPEGVYYHFQIIGLEVITTDGRVLGKISQVLDTAGNDVYVVKTGKKEILIPAIKDVVKKIDLENGKMTIEVIEGLLS